MADNIISFPGITTHELDAAMILREIADESDPKEVFVICWPKDGSMPSYHSSMADVPVIMLRLQQFIHKFYNGDFND